MAAGIWVLDDISMLRQLTPAVASEPAHLFKPGDAVRVRRNVNANTPFPQEVPHALNPPGGVIIDYTLASAPTGEITLDVLDASGAVVRHMSSGPAHPVPEAARPTLPNFWEAPPVVLPAKVGANRVSWDLRYDAPPVFAHTFELSANPGLTPPSPEGPLALPGTYTAAPDGGRAGVYADRCGAAGSEVGGDACRATGAACAGHEAREGDEGDVGGVSAGCHASRCRPIGRCHLTRIRK